MWQIEATRKTLVRYLYPFLKNLGAVSYAQLLSKLRKETHDPVISVGNTARPYQKELSVMVHAYSPYYLGG